MISPSMGISPSFTRIYPLSINVSHPILPFLTPLRFMFLNPFKTNSQKLVFYSTSTSSHTLQCQTLDNLPTESHFVDPQSDILTESDPTELGSENAFPRFDDACPNHNAKADVTSIKGEGTKVPSCDANDSVGEPYILTMGGDLPLNWDSSRGIVVLVNKPKGWTSFKVCEKLRRLVKVKKVGHAGTLDPSATGLLIVCVGKATKYVIRFQSMIKGYSGVFRLGEATSTLDGDSPVIQRESWEHIEDDDIKKASASFYGETWQVPPMFSAIKVKGERMYEKARRGESIGLSPRKISISQFDIKRSLDDRQNLIFSVTCSKGTYIRSLCADFGKALGSCSYLAALQRDSIGRFSVGEAWKFEDLAHALTEKNS